MFKRYNLDELKDIQIDLTPGDIIYLYGDLAAGKTTFSKHIINTLLGVNDEVRSPTYTYYNKYGSHIYHFDLYRLSNYDEFFAIGGEEILDNEENISLVEWPELITPYFKPTIEIYLKKTDQENEREIEIKRV